MESFRLYKKEKLCSQVAIDALFSRRVNCVDAKCDAVDSALVYPLRLVWRRNDGRQRGASVQFLVSIPKKRLGHAVDRVKMRRRVREAYRLNRGLLPEPADGGKVDMAFVYVASELTTYVMVERAVCKLLKRMAGRMAKTPVE